ncbi:baseplate J/gp47 family protein [Providencia huaxiensis]|uniref:baseplate J/gp47 family protein n=1 Tax=Providencia huaxiensis TaxID=2027290 RepID=UPI001B365DE6|nr:baseplate J/gp47 family protein [Providencia huaxiensis]MBQ0533478.1 baseplate J/gp47 family protein [Providencia huaxiensis]MBQ0587035.1 baseplate J/gp47 family protein [Providencia huaxiensis]
MPFKRKTLSELRAQSEQFIRSELKEPGALLRFSNLRILADMTAGMSHMHYGYLDYIAKQTTPFTATDEWLAGWGALKRVYRKAPQRAQCPNVKATGVPGTLIRKGSKLNRGDGYQYETVDDAIITHSGEALISIIAVLPDINNTPEEAGYLGNSPAGTLLTLDISIAGVSSELIAMAPIAGGTDIESEALFRSRTLEAYQNPAQGGNTADYLGWAKEVPGVTRAWVRRRLLGGGTVGIYVMCDGNSNHGFPIGTDGPATQEVYQVHATGDQLRVADHLYDLQPVTALVWVCSPINKKVNFVLKGLTHLSAEERNALHDAIDHFFYQRCDPANENKITPADIDRSIYSSLGLMGYQMISPNTDIELGIGEIPTRGEVIYT